MDTNKFLAVIPKVELHIHLAGTITASKLFELAKKNDIPLPYYKEIRELYEYETLSEFLKIYRLANQCLQTTEDFRTVTYQSLEDSASANVKYREMFWNPSDHLAQGVTIQESYLGIKKGIDDAYNDFGIICKLIASINRESSPAVAEEMVSEIIGINSPDIIGIGADYDTVYHDPLEFAPAYRLAKKHGLYRTSHVCEATQPASDAMNCLAVLECNRLDHGYRIMSDPEIVKLCIDRDILFTTIPMADRSWIISTFGEWDKSKHPIRNMVGAGLKIMIDTDDPGIMGKNIYDAYMIAVHEIGFSVNDIKTFIMNSIDGSFLEDNVKREWKKDWSAEIDALLAEP